ncbi:transcription-repair coupling factor (superfamily II helicase) [Friedmanniella endophytica]|uniref:Transcription-repair-coupling factor n=1 Tax=Microlunatus kandeliicorticis TaxID=1759536 RepID=A0A7W3P658_9ACTN|nr:transcription-repair coupling factor [Microlunatus kandeliicorticis]MBA8794580.1 transcription-repair coupling factor (superfamily II helicase) [Microlunatus kandeliicorticis]
MSLAGLVDLFATDPSVSEFVGDARSRTVSALDLTAPPQVRPLVAAVLAASTERGGADRPVLLVTPTYREAEAVTEELGSLLPPEQVAYYPAWETLPHERLSPRSDTVGRRLAVLRRLVHPDPDATPLKIIVAPIRSVLQPQVKGLADLTPVRLAVGEEFALDDLAAALVGAAYVRVDLVERRGEFAVRGGIVDVFPPTEEHPVRVDFFGDEVEEIRHFSVADQRSADDTVTEVVASPCRELLLTDAVRARAAQLAADHPELAEMCERIAQGHAVEGMESLSPALVDGMELLVELLPDDCHVLIADPELVRGRAQDLVTTSQEFLGASWAAAAGGGKAPIDLGASAYRSLADVREVALGHGLAWWSLSPFSAGPDAETATQPVRTEDGEIVDFSTRVSGVGVESRTLAAHPVEQHRGDTEAAVADIAGRARDGWRVVLVAEGRGTARRMTELLNDREIPARLAEQLDEAPSAGLVTVSCGEMRHGVLLDGVSLALFTASDLSGQRSTDRETRRMPAKRRNQIDPLELTAGDPVVHEQHGVGRYVEMTQRSVGGSVREYMIIEYAASKRGQPGDRLYVPMDQLDQITRYVGGESPTLDKMGGADWSKRKSRARKAVREIASELIKLYAARQASRGHAFGPDTTWQRELEDAFNYVETPDQLACIDEVKHDMEQVIPMDRLICGDVGYGKTEIAVRAAFKAVQDGKQVAVLVPTTLLVQQHHATFADRYAGFPVNVAPLSRFVSAKDTKATIEGIADGTVDVVVGTHRLLSGEIQFKDLGLVIIDEEQRFGVEHKEQLKRLRTSVDVLAMSATPIPRTLEMAITGIREMSTITTPPEERHPVLTFAGPYDEAQVVAAIRRELLREGQVFYIHNRVQSIDKVARRLGELVPEARVATAHGQMGEHRLEQVMVDFWERRADVLVCTTIVEAGLDISTANTLLIERSDTMGLSQLHQLRGRVGRGRERGYAYFLYPPEKPLTETAHDRLATIAAHTDLGAGMAVAMKDLEIRGAGNLLGGEQSGHIADVGFDLYIRLVGEAVAEFRGDDREPEPEVRIELPVEAHLPVDYVESERLRLEMYKRIAEVRGEEDIAAVVSELTDRYGAPGPAVTNLLEVARFRLVARQAGLTDVISQGNQIRFSPVSLLDSQQLRLKRLYPGSVVKEAAGLMLVPRPKTAVIGGAPVRDAELLRWCTEVINAVLLSRPAAAA